MTGIFSQFQPLYAEHGLTLFPCSTAAKKPLVSHHFKMGIRASSELARRFTAANALGFASGQRSRVTVLDVDVPDQRVLEDAIARHGEPRIVVRTASGKFHAYYRFNGEPRKIRPWRDRPIDLLGHQGVVFAPPSLFGQGKYEIITGTLDDLDRLTTMRGVDDLKPKPKQQAATAEPAEPAVGDGRRNLWLFRECMRRAHRCDNLDALLDIARTRNQNCTPPLEDSEVMTIAQNAWGYEQRGLNKFNQHGVWFQAEEIAVMMRDQDAFMLLAFLRAHNGRLATFMCANGLTETFGWRRERLAAARRRLIAMGYMEQIQRPHTGSPARYRWGSL